MALPFLSRTGRAKILAMEDLRLLFMIRGEQEIGVVDVVSADDARVCSYGLVVKDCA